jgi:hypothetical protein
MEVSNNETYESIKNIKLNMAICIVLEPNKNFISTSYSKNIKQLTGIMGREPNTETIHLPTTPGQRI